MTLKLFDSKKGEKAAKKNQLIDTDVLDEDEDDVPDEDDEEGVENLNRNMCLFLYI